MPPHQILNVLALLEERSRNLVGQGRVQQERSQSVEIIAVFNWPLSCCNVSSECRERKGNTARYRVFTNRFGVALPRMTTTGVLPSNEMTPQSKTPGCLMA